MPKRKVKKTRLSVSLRGVQKETLQEMADRYEVSLTRVVQEAVKEFLENHQDRRLPLLGAHAPGHRRRPSCARTRGGAPAVSVVARGATADSIRAAATPTK